MGRDWCWAHGRAHSLGLPRPIQHIINTRGRVRRVEIAFEGLSPVSSSLWEALGSPFPSSQSSSNNSSPTKPS